MTKWDDAYMDVAERFASLSTANRLKVGAIIVKENRIISIGYNGMPSGWSNDCEEVVTLPHWAKTIEDVSEVDRKIYVEYKTKAEVIHAEANAIAKLASTHESGKDADMYITHAPCLSCAKQIYSSGINKVYYRDEYRTRDGIDFLGKCGVKVIKHENT